MQVSVEQTGALERRMEIHVPAAEIEKAIDARLQSMSRTVRLKGFRPGKVPVKVVRQQFGSQVRQEVLGDVVQSSFNEAVSKEKLQPVAGPRIEPISMESGQDLKYRAVFEVFPTVELKGVEDLKITRPAATVSDADVDAMIEHLRAQRPNFVAVEREAQDKDRVMVDFKGTIDGVPFEGGTGENVPVILGSGRMLAEFEAGLRGMKAGEQKTIDLTFPENYPAKHLAGKKAEFSLTARTVEEQQLPELNDEFCKAYGVEEGGIEQLRREVRENMERELSEAIRSRVKQQVMDGLLAANQIELPKALVDAQVRELQQEARRRSGAPQDAPLPPAENFADTAKRRVALGLLVSEVIKAGNIQLDRSRVQQKLEELIAQFPDPQQALKMYREDRQTQRQIESFVLEEQVVDYLVERAQVSEQPASFRELMNFGA